MSDKIFGEVEPKCAYCEHGQIASNSVQVLCIKRGIFDLNHSCKKFKYDPLKKIPQASPDMQEYSEEDFTI